MKIIKLTILALFLVSAVSKAQVKDTLTNAKIVQLTKIGLAPSIIINKIKTSVNLFDVSTNSLIDLSNNKVATDVINEIRLRTQTCFAHGIANGHNAFLLALGETAAFEFFFKGLKSFIGGVLPVNRDQFAEFFQKFRRIFRR